MFFFFFFSEHGTAATCLVHMVRIVSKNCFQETCSERENKKKKEQKEESI